MQASTKSNLISFRQSLICTATNTKQQLKKKCWWNLKKID